MLESSLSLKYSTRLKQQLCLHFAINMATIKSSHPRAIAHDVDTVKELRAATLVRMTAQKQIVH